MAMPPSTTTAVQRQRSCLSLSMCSWCNDEKARPTRGRGAGILPCRRAAFHIDVRHLRSRTLCDHDAVAAGAFECRCPGIDDRQLLRECRTPEEYTQLLR